MFILTSSLVVVESLVGTTSASADPAVGPSVGAGVAGPGANGTTGLDNSAIIVVNGGVGGQVAGGGTGGVNSNNAALNGANGGAIGIETGGNGGPDNDYDSGPGAVLDIRAAAVVPVR